MTVQDIKFPLVTLYYVWVSFVYSLSLNYAFSIQIENGIENAISFRNPLPLARDKTA